MRQLHPDYARLVDAYIRAEDLRSEAVQLFIQSRQVTSDGTIIASPGDLANGELDRADEMIAEARRALSKYELSGRPRHREVPD